MICQNIGKTLCNRNAKKHITHWYKTNNSSQLTCSWRTGVEKLRRNHDCLSQIPGQILGTPYLIITCFGPGFCFLKIRKVSFSAFVIKPSLPNGRPLLSCWWVVFHHQQDRSITTPAILERSPIKAQLFRIQFYISDGGDQIPPVLWKQTESSLPKVVSPSLPENDISWITTMGFPHRSS